MPEDPATLKALLRAALAERDRERQRAEAQESLAREKSALAAQQGKRADDLYVQTLRLQLELERYKKWYYGPRADRLKSSRELAQALLNFGEELEQKPVSVEEAAAASEPATELRRVKRRRGRPSHPTGSAFSQEHRSATRHQAAHRQPQAIDVTAGRLAYRRDPSSP